MRIQRGYSVSELAEEANISTKFMYKIEEGKTGFSARVLYDIADALNVSCDYILKGDRSDNVSTINEVIQRFDENEQMSIERILIEIMQLKSN